MTKKRKMNIFIPIGILAALGLAIFTSSKPFKVFQQEKEKADDMRTELNALQKSNLKLREKDQLMNPVQKEEEARRLGYVRPEEHALPDKSATPPPVVKPDAKLKKPDPDSEPMDLRDGDRNDAPTDLR